MRNKAMQNYITPLLLSSFAGLVISLSACAEANSTEKSQAVSSEMAAGNWDIQPEGSHIKFSADQEGKPFTGEFQDFSGIISFNPDALETSFVKITIPLKSVEAGSKDRNSTLPGKVWFSTKKFPTAVYTSSDISSDGTGYIAKGALMLKGTSVPFDIPFELNIDGDIAVMTAFTGMDRTLWNVGAAPWDTDEWVSRTVKLDVKVTAVHSK